MPDAASIPTVEIALIGGVVSIIVAIIGGVVAVKIGRIGDHVERVEKKVDGTDEKVVEVGLKVDGRMEELLRISKALAMAQGIVEGTKAESARSDAASVATLREKAALDAPTGHKSNIG